MYFNDQNKPKRSLGALRKTPKTKPKSPDVQGTMKAQRHTIETLMKQLDDSDDNEVIANLAGWFNEDQNGQFITVELSQRFVSRRQEQRQEPAINMFDQFFHDKEEVH